MTSGLHINNDDDVVQLSNDTYYLTYQHKNTYHLTKKNTEGSLIGLTTNNGEIYAYRSNANDLFKYFGVVNHYIPKNTTDRFAVTVIDVTNEYRPDIFQVIVEQYAFKANLLHQTNVGLQLFDENGVELYNSQNKLLNILEEGKINLNDIWDMRSKDGKDNIKYWKSKTYTDKKLGIMFKNVPFKFLKFSNLRTIEAPSFRFLTLDDHVQVAVRFESFLPYFSVDWFAPGDYYFEFFIVDLTGL